jgi:cell division protein FtsZ
LPVSQKWEPVLGQKQAVVEQIVMCVAKSIRRRDKGTQNMSINLKMPDIKELRPRIIVFGAGGAGGNAVNNMIHCGLQGVDFVVANTDAQALTLSASERVIQMGVSVTEGLGAGSQPEIGRAAAEEVIDEITDHMSSAHMVFITAGMGGGTGTGAAPVIARAAREMGILTVGVVTKPFHFEGQRRMRVAEAGIEELQACVDTLICIPNQNLFRIANDKTTFADAFAMADQVLYSGVACITDLMVKEGLINLDFADVRSIMRGMGKAMMGTGEASGDKRAIQAAEAAIANPLLDDVSMRGAKGLLISITGGEDMTLFEVDEAATRIREEVDPDANIILGATFDETLEGLIRVSVVATGIDADMHEEVIPADVRMAELINRPRTGEGEFQPQKRVNQLHREVPTINKSFEVEADLALPKPKALVAEAPKAKKPVQPKPLASDPAVKIGPFKPDPAMLEEPELDEDLLDAAVEEAVSEARQDFVPPVAETPEVRKPRIPTIEEFPQVAQREVRAANPASYHSNDEEDRGAMGLLRKLANVGLNRKEEEEQAARKAKQVHQAQERSGHGAYAPGASGLDATGRVQPRAQTSEEEHLEIPAFLRRQSN